MTVTHTDYLLKEVGTSPVVTTIATTLSGVWIRLRNNDTSTDYYSTAVTDSGGGFTHSAPPGDYSLYSGTAATVVGTPDIRNTHYAVPVTSEFVDSALVHLAGAETVTGVKSAADIRFGGHNWYDVTHVTYGADPTGVADSTAAIQAAINDANTAGGGIVFLPKGSYKLTATLTVIDKPQVKIRGIAGSSEPFSAGLAGGTKLVWAGAGGGTMVSMGASNGATVYARDNELSYVTIDGVDSAGIGLLLTSSWYGVYEEVHITRCTVAHLDMTTIVGPGAAIGEDGQYNQLRRVTTRPTAGASANAIGLRMDSGATPQAGQGNTSMNEFFDCFFGHYNGVGVQIIDADSNRFYGLITHSNGGTGIGLELRGSAVLNYGHARANTFYFLDACGSQGGIVARGTASYPTQPAQNNRILHLNQENNHNFVPTVEAGATLRWTGSHQSGGWPRSSPRVKALAEGLLAMSMDRLAVPGFSVLVTQAAYFVPVPLFAGDIISSIVVWVNGAGSGLTLVKVGLYNSTGTLLASSADNKANFTSSGVFVATSLSSAYTITADGEYYLSILSVGTGPPGLARQTGNNSFYSNAYSTGMLASGAQTGQADLPSPATISANGTAGLWIAAAGTPVGGV